VELFVKQITTLALVAVLSACASQQQSGSSTPAPGTPAAAAAASQPGGATPLDALERFLASIRDQDIQATQRIWGTKSGPVLSSDMPRENQEKSIIIMQCFLGQSSFRVVNDAPGENESRIFQVELTNSGRARQTPFTVVRGPRSRWFVESADLEPVKEFCRNPPRS
jgi:hypothetical protein